ncbi:MAG: ECF-type sigma factor [Pseudomonadales bacterium]
MSRVANGSGDDVTLLLRQYASGETRSLNQVISIVYHELHGIAHKQLRRSSVAQVQTTALVHEAYEKLLQGQTQDLQDRRHFFAVASRAMRQIVVDTYRSESAAKRGGDAAVLTLTANDIVSLDDPQQFLLVHRALEMLAAESHELSEVVDLACFGGLNSEEIAELTETTPRTVQRRLKRAQAWLAHFMQHG